MRNEAMTAMKFPKKKKRKRNKKVERKKEALR